MTDKRPMETREEEFWRLAWLGLAIGLGLAAWPGRAGADRLKLKNGNEVTGVILEKKADAVIIELPNGAKIPYWLDEIAKLEDVEDPPRPVKAVAGASARASVSASLAPEQEALIDDVWRLSGLAEQMEQLEASVKDQATELQSDQRFAKMPPEVRAEMIAIIGDAFQRERIEPASRDVLRRRFDEAKYRQLAERLGAPPIPRLVQLARSLYKPEAKQELARFIETIQRQPPPAARMAMVERLNSAMHSSEGMFQMITAIMLGLARGLETSMDLKPGEVMREFDKARASYSGQARALIDDAVQVQLLFAYRQADDAELARLAEFWESELGQWYGSILFEAMGQAYGQAAERMATQIMPMAARHGLRSASHSPAPAAGSAASTP